MIPTPVLYNDNADYTIVIMMIACCLIVLATIMIPKAIRHRKRIKECEKPVQNEEQEVEMIVVPSEKTIHKKSVTNYKEQFLVKADIPTRSGKLVGIRKKYHERISKIVGVAGDNEVSIFSYVDNVLKHHFENFQDDISEFYKKKFDDDYFIPKK